MQSVLQVFRNSVFFSLWCIWYFLPTYQALSKYLSAFVGGDLKGEILCIAFFKNMCNCHCEGVIYLFREEFELCSFVLSQINQSTYNIKNENNEIVQNILDNFYIIICGIIQILRLTTTTKRSNAKCWKFGGIQINKY